jgi:electron transfer flavoprotein alpha/beta subunit
MNYYLISFGHPRDTRSERNYLADGGDQAILVRADDQNEAEEIARTRLDVVAPAVVHAHLVARILEG